MTSISINVELTPETCYDDLAQALADVNAAAQGKGPGGAKITTPAASASKTPTDAEKKAAAAKKRKDAAAAKKKAAEEAQAAEDALVGDDGGPVTTLDDVKAAVKSYIEANDIDAMKAILKDTFGAAKLSEVDEGRYDELMGLLTA